jgi:hypothetical protein
MYMMVKSLFTTGAMICVSIVLVQILFVNFFLGFLLLISIFLMIFSDILLGWKVSPFKALFEPTPKGKEGMEIQLLDGTVIFMNTVKGPQGKRSFVVNGHDASVINDGKSQFRIAGGNVLFRAHELIDRNVDVKRCKALEQMPGDNIKELYYHARALVDDSRES